MTDRSQLAARLAAVTQITFAALLGAVASFAFEPGLIPRGAALFALFALPGLVGLLGVRARRPALLVAAGLTSAVGAFVAFSGVTLIFLIPALLFLAGALQLATAPSAAGEGRRIAGIAQGVLAAAVVVLLLGAGASVLLQTDSGCWSAIRTPLGLRLDQDPFTTGETAVPIDAIWTHCSTGLLSVRGVGLGAVLAGSGFALAVVAARRRVPAPAPSSTAGRLAGG